MATDTRAGQAIYNPRTLPLYDLVVLRLSNPLIWRCPTARILDLYDRHAGRRISMSGSGPAGTSTGAAFPRPRRASA